MFYQKRNSDNKFKLASNNWTLANESNEAIPNFPVTDWQYASTELNGKYHIIHGSDIHYTYNPSTTTWESKTPMTLDVVNPYVGSIGDKIYAIGGQPYTNSVYEWDSATDTWTSLGFSKPDAASAFGVYCNYENSIFLDSCYSSDSDTSHYDSGNFNFEDTYIPPTQRNWLQNQINISNEPIVIFVHNPIRNEVANSTYIIDNALTVRSIIESSSNPVLAIIQAHAHDFNLDYLNKNYYVSFDSVVDNPYPDASYSKLTFRNNGKVTIEEFGENSDIW